MRYFSLLTATTVPDGPPPGALMAAIAALGEDANRAGVLLDTAGWRPARPAPGSKLTGGTLGVVDGPFTEAKELVSYAVYQVGSKEEAVEWSTRFMDLHLRHWPGWEGTTLVLKVFGPEDFAPLD
jgi:hypothetical protein